MISVMWNFFILPPLFETLGDFCQWLIMTAKRKKKSELNHGLLTALPYFGQWYLTFCVCLFLG
uniref:Uncharacterized protein n=1 Tax=Anguilla anguilla TaxID=7936 RepID=A0A0E9VKQ0_ANGAN